MDNSAKRHIFSHSGPLIALFAKQPIPGQVKTRLTPSLSAEQACQLYQVALRETVARLQGAGLPLLLCYAGRREWFRAAFPGLPLLAQVGDGLGARLRHAVQTLFAAGAGPVLLAGADSPDLPLALIGEVVTVLQDKDVAVIPCSDGGYAVVGLRQPTTQLFAGIPWSTSEVLAATRQRCALLGLTMHETAPWHDLDEAADLRQLVIRSPATQTARHILAELADLL